LPKTGGERMMNVLLKQGKGHQLEMNDLSEDAEPGNSAGSVGNVVPLYPARRDGSAEIVSFNRRELDHILRLYGRKVASGEWRDYAIDMLRDRAVFSVFKRTAETPLYRIEKNPKLAKKQGAYSIVNAAGMILKRGHELETVLRIFEGKPKLYPV
jgi:hypothetical protein